jgi:hypothetical protein
VEIRRTRTIIPAISGVLPVTGERPIALFLPPDPVRTLSVPPPAELAIVVPKTSLLVGVAVVDRSGRVRDRVLITALGWSTGDRLHCEVHSTALVLTFSPDGQHSIDSRDQVFIPAGARAVFGIGAGDRVVLVAAPEVGTLLVHPSAVIQDVLAHYYASLPGGLGVD